MARLSIKKIVPIMERGDHSRVAARVANYYYRCMNPAFGITKKDMVLDDEVYLEHPNSHSSIYHQAFSFPSPLADREVICNIVWKRLSEKTVVVAYHPLTSHPLVENKDGKSVIRGSFHYVFQVTQLDDRTTEINWGFHINFGGKLPKVVVNSVIIPNFNRALSHHQVYFANSIDLANLSKSDGKLLGEVLVNQIKTARKRGGWKKHAELGKVGVDEFLYISDAMRSYLSAFLYANYYDEDNKLNTATLQAVLVSLSALWLVSAVTFISSIKHKYIHTFYNFDTTSDYDRNLWETERPAWFTDAWIEVVPNDYIPYDWQVKYKKTKGRVDDPGMRRRSSLQQVKTLLGGTEEDR
ncbi:hypothetical protein TrVE_jg9907 [Triparma verrucosa]|uniref:Uncharacterized protein n=1 Tax=Triparma verrucosa TaxID=1606542 RepID=A0A9W7C7R8_9STRA|nr:hypothetical protein TrVE_jg9907 [Triparma verrucosa]